MELTIKAFLLKKYCWYCALDGLYNNYLIVNLAKLFEFDQYI